MQHTVILQNSFQMCGHAYLLTIRNGESDKRVKENKNEKKVNILGTVNKP